jgi:hypothetical protein
LGRIRTFTSPEAHALYARAALLKAPLTGAFLFPTISPEAPDELSLAESLGSFGNCLWVKQIFQNVSTASISAFADCSPNKTPFTLQ